MKTAEIKATHNKQRPNPKVVAYLVKQFQNVKTPNGTIDSILLYNQNGKIEKSIVPVAGNIIDVFVL